jgi:hypothetical protein
VLQHLPQVRVIARQIHDRLPDSVCLDDLVSTGVVGLLAAVDNFDPSYNVQLNTYAERRIRGAIMDSLRDLDWAPRETRKRSKMIEAAIHRAKQRLGREPLEEEIASELGITPDQYRQWLNDAQGIDLQRLESSGRDDQPDLLKFISDDEGSPAVARVRAFGARANPDPRDRADAEDRTHGPASILLRRTHSSRNRERGGYAPFPSGAVAGPGRIEASQPPGQGVELGPRSKH